MEDKQIKDIKWHDLRLPNGSRLIHIPRDPDDQRFFFGVIVKTGSRNEENFPNGISHFLEHMMFRGSKNYPSFEQLSEEFEWLGGEWNAETGHEFTHYTYNGVARNSRKVLELFHEFLTSPLFCDMERERNIIIREIEDDLNEFGHSTDMDEHLSKVFWDGHQISYPIAGSKESVKNTKLEEIRKYHSQQYTPSNTIYCSVGPQQSKEIFTHFENIFANDRPPQALTKNSSRNLPAFSGPQGKWIEHSDSQYHLQISFLCEGENSPATKYYDLIARTLTDGFNARLTNRIREELGLVYDIEASSSQHTDCGSFDIEASATSENLLEVIDESLTILEQLLLNGFKQREFEKAKIRALIDYEMISSDYESIGFHTGWQILQGHHPSLSKEYSQLMDIKIEQLHTEAKKLFSPKNLGWVLLGPKDNHLIEEVKKRMSTWLKI